jgi:hypothetical protein
MPAVTTISQLPAADIAKLTGSALVAVDDADGQTRKVTLAQLRGAASIFDVLAFGAIGNGVALDAPKIQDALNAAAAAGGGTVTMPRGHFNLSRQGVSFFDPVDIPGGISACGGYALHIPSGVTLQGMGYDTVLLNGGMVPNLGGDQNDNGTWYSAIEFEDGTFNAGVRGVRVKGENGTGGVGFQDQSVYYQQQMDCVGVRGRHSHDITIEDCWFEDQYGFSVHCEGNADRVNIINCRHLWCANGLNSNAHYSIQMGNTLYHCEGIETDGRHIIVANNNVQFSTEAGISIGGETTPGEAIHGVVCVGNVVSDSAKEGIRATDALDGAIIGHNTVSRTKKSGIIVQSDGANGVARVQVINNVVKDAGLATADIGDRAGIYVAYNPDGYVGGNTVEYSFTAGYDTAYGLLLGANCQGMRVSGNHLRGSFRDVGCTGTDVIFDDTNVLDWKKIDFFGTGSFRAFPRRQGSVLVPFPGSGGAVVLDPTLGNHFRVIASDTTPFTISVAAPATPGALGLDTHQSQKITVAVYNGAGAGITANFSATPVVGFRLAGAFVQPAANKGRIITADWDTTTNTWVESARTMADV